MEKQELDTSWFDLKNYEKLNELDLFGWHWQLERRAEIYHYPEIIKKENEKAIQNLRSFGYIDNIKDESTRNLVESFWLPFDKNDNGLRPEFVKSIKENPIPNDVLTINDLVFTRIKKNSVRAMTVGDISNYLIDYRLRDYILDEDGYKLLDVFVKERIDVSEYDPSEPDGYSCNVKINLNFSDEQIINDIRLWLTKHRKITGYLHVQKKDSKKPLEQFRNKEFKQWIEHRVLPYIDLKLVEKHERKTIKQDKLIELLFSDKYFLNPDEKIKKTVKPIADWLLSESTLKAMKLQIASSERL